MKIVIIILLIINLAAIALMRAYRALAAACLEYATKKTGTLPTDEELRACVRLATKHIF